MFLCAYTDLLLMIDFDFDFDFECDFGFNLLLDFAFAFASDMRLHFHLHSYEIVLSRRNCDSHDPSASLWNYRYVCTSESSSPTHRSPRPCQETPAKYE